MTKGVTNKDRFRELAVKVLSETDVPLGKDVLRERVLDLAKSRGQSVILLSNIHARNIHSTLLFDKEKRFSLVSQNPNQWSLRDGVVVNAA